MIGDVPDLRCLGTKGQRHPAPREVGFIQQPTQTSNNERASETDNIQFHNMHELGAKPSLVQAALDGAEEGFVVRDIPQCEISLPTLRWLSRRKT